MVARVRPLLSATAGGLVLTVPKPFSEHHASGGEAIALARAAVAKGLADATPLLTDPDFDPVRDRDEFRLLLDELKGRKK